MNSWGGGGGEGEEGSFHESQSQSPWQEKKHQKGLTHAQPKCITLQTHTQFFFYTMYCIFTPNCIVDLWCDLAKFEKQNVEAGAQVSADNL